MQQGVGGWGVHAYRSARWSKHLMRGARKVALPNAESRAINMLPHTQLLPAKVTWGAALRPRATTCCRQRLNQQGFQVARQPETCLTGSRGICGMTWWNRKAKQARSRLLKASVWRRDEAAAPA